MADQLTWSQWRTPDEGVHHVISDPAWTPDMLNYVERCQLNALLVALAEIVYPGEYQDYLVQQQTRSILSNDQNGDDDGG